MTSDTAKHEALVEAANSTFGDKITEIDKSYGDLVLVADRGVVHDVLGHGRSPLDGAIYDAEATRASRAQHLERQLPHLAKPDDRHVLLCQITDVLFCQRDGGRAHAGRIAADIGTCSRLLTRLVRGMKHAGQNRTRQTGVARRLVCLVDLSEDLGLA